jgi:hypothetical protein
MVSTMDSYSLLGHYVIPYTLYLVLHNDWLMPVRHVYPTHVNLIKHNLLYTSFSPCWWQAHLFRSFAHTYLLCCPMDLALTSYSSLVLIYISTFLPAVLLLHQKKTLHVVDLFCWAADGLAIGGAVAILWVSHWLPHRTFAPGPVHSLYRIALSLPPTYYSSYISSVSMADVTHEMESHDEVVWDFL